MISVVPSRRGVYQPTKGDFPVRYGERGIVTTAELELEFDRAGRLRTARGLSREWPHPGEYLKRTDGNDWVYYALGEYADFLGLYGEHYLPCPDYPTNRPLGGEPFRRPAVREVLRAWPEAIQDLRKHGSSLNKDQRLFADRVVDASTPESLANDAKRLHEIIGSAIPVLPPDARHVDYDVVPLIVTDGCRYGCRFCCVNDGLGLAPRSRGRISEQITELRQWLGPQIGNLQGLFLGLHDALAADDDLLRWVIDEAARQLGFEGSPFRRPQLTMFGSVDSLLTKGELFYKWLDDLPWSSFINVGLEAADSKTLRRLGKPLSLAKVQAGFERMLELNSRFTNLEVTANFVLMPEDGEAADESLVELLASRVTKPTSRGACYLSPLMVGSRRPRTNRRALIQRVHRLQRAAPLPMSLYLIQRL